MNKDAITTISIALFVSKLFDDKFIDENDKIDIVSYVKKYDPELAVLKSIEEGLFSSLESEKKEFISSIKKELVRLIKKQLKAKGGADADEQE